MITLYRVRTASTAPRIGFSDACAGTDVARASFDGRSLRSLEVLPPPQLVELDVAATNTFWSLGPGVLVVEAQVVLDNENLYHSLFGVELVELRTTARRLVVLNPTTIVPPATPPHTGPCNLHSWNVPIFRIGGRQRTELYFVSGRDKSNDDIRSHYESNALRGLEFDVCWQGSIGECR